MSDLLLQLIVRALGGAIVPLLLLPAIFWGSRRSLPRVTALGSGYFAICAAMGVAGLTLFSEAGAEGTEVRKEVTQERERLISPGRVGAWAAKRNRAESPK